MSTLLNDLFGGSDDEDENESTPGASVPQQPKMNVDEMFESSDDEDEVKTTKATSRLKKGKKSGSSASKVPKVKKPKKASARLEKRAREVDSDDDEPSSNKKTTPAASAYQDNSNAYDSGDELVVTKEDDNFIDAEDDLADIAKEYDAEKQEFNDLSDDEFENRDREREEPKSEGNKDLQKQMRQDKKKVKDMELTEKVTIVSSLFSYMEDAWTKDMEALLSGRPAVHKLAMLDKVCKILGQRNLHDALLEQGILEQIRNWLFPFPNEDDFGKDLPLSKRILPNLTLRSKLYELLLTMPITPEHLKNSERGGVGRQDWPGLGKVVMLLMKHPNETNDQKRVLKRLLENWSRLLFNKPKDFRQMSKSMPESENVYKPTHSSGSAFGNSRLNRSTSEVVDDLDNQESMMDMASADGSSRASRPFRVGFDFKVKPKKVEIKPAKISKTQAKKNALGLKLKELQKIAKSGSQRGVVPSNKVYD